MPKDENKATTRKKELFYENKHVSSRYNKEKIEKSNLFAKGYIDFLNANKTEREVVDYTRALLKKNGYVSFDPSVTYTEGDKIYYVNRKKAIILATIGKKDLREGTRVLAAHIDSPRLDLKPRPLYEENELALLKTHYYGGIKKYQWTAIPLSLHGIVIKKNGEKVSIRIGDKEGDPVFTVTDLLPHLAREQEKRTLGGGIKGEELNILVGSLPFSDDSESELVKLAILDLIYEKTGIVEEDLISAELEAVPALKASDVGLDRSMIGAYGQDDRICAYTALMAAVETESPEYTTVTILADKEETGSNSNTGMDTLFVRNFYQDLGKPLGIDGHTIIARSKCLSTDVTAAYDPTFPTVSEKQNSAFLGHGVALCKYTGSGGKYGTSDATAEFVYQVTNLLNEANVPWQICELGKVDEGGGGTVAVYLSKLDMDVIDMGVPLLSMHSPFEISSKLDTYACYEACLAFIQ